MTMHYAPGVRVEAWHQSGAELAALYSWRGAWILFDRFNTVEGVDTVIVVSATTLELQLSAGELVMSTQSNFDDAWSRVASDD